MTSNDQLLADLYAIKARAAAESLEPYEVLSLQIMASYRQYERANAAIAHEFMLAAG